MVNGPEDEITGWSSINWRWVEDDVRRLRQRIFAASQVGDLAKVRNLQKLMLRSRANSLVIVRWVTEINAGRNTAGIDGKTALLPQDKTELADWVQRRATPWKPQTRETGPRINNVDSAARSPGSIEKFSAC